MKKIPEIRFPEFSGEWVEKRLGDVCKFFSGGTPSTTNKNFWNGDIPFIKSGEIHKERVSNYITNEGLSNSSAKMIRKGDLLLALYGATSGEVALSKINGAINQAILCIRCKELYIPFLYYVLNKNKNKIINKYTQGGQPNLSSKIIQSLYFLFPPTLTEQEKIAEFLSSVDEKIEITAKKIEKLKQYKKGLLQKMLNVINGEPEIRFKEFSGKWVEKRLEEIGDTYGGLNNKNKEHFNKGKDLYIPFMNIMINTIIDNNYLENVIIYPNENQNIVKKGDILFTTSSETPNEVGMCSVYLGDKKVYLNSFCFGFRLKNSNIDSLFLTYLLRYKRKLFYKIAQGATRYNLSKKHFNDLKIHIPPTLTEQEKIAEFLSSIDKKIELEKNRLEKLKVYKKGLLQKMFV
jgi:type I restriction enzyme S subunit